MSGMLRVSKFTISAHKRFSSQKKMLGRIKNDYFGDSFFRDIQYRNKRLQEKIQQEDKIIKDILREYEVYRQTHDKHYTIHRNHLYWIEKEMQMLLKD